ncbi:MAG: histidine phosphatase family protein [Deltaproteobacteria bacterium]|nr:histidine phosphatase family protein [Deltaproteobacteria bacterium]
MAASLVDPNVQRVIFIRHGQPWTGEADPALSPAGHAMAAAAASWAAGLGWPLARVLHTATRRTGQTAEALVAQIDAPVDVVWAEPLSLEDWELLVDGQRAPHPFGDRSMPRPPPAPFAYVGHHTTLTFLLQLCAASVPAGLHARAWAAGLALERRAGRWLIVAGWPGVAQP